MEPQLLKMLDVGRVSLIIGIEDTTDYAIALNSLKDGEVTRITRQFMDEIQTIPPIKVASQ